MILNEKRPIPNQAINYDICATCAALGNCCCLISPCNYTAMDFTEFNEETLITLLEAGDAIIEYDPELGYDLRPRTDVDPPGKYLAAADSPQGTCVFLKWHLENKDGKLIKVSDGCLLKTQSRPGTGVNLIPNEEFKCGYDEEFINNIQHDFRPYQKVFEQVLINHGELWISPYTGNQIFAGPYGLSHEFFQSNTTDFFNILIDWGQRVIKTDLSKIDWNREFKINYIFYLQYADFDDHNIYNIYLMKKDGTIKYYLDLNRFRELMGKDVTFDYSINHESLKEGLPQDKPIKITITFDFQTLYNLCQNSVAKPFSLEKRPENN